MTAGRRHGLQAFAVAGVTALAMALSPPQAWPEPGQAGGTLADAPSLSLAELGGDRTLPFYGVDGTASVTLPVPKGLVPTELTAVVETPVNLAAGTLTVAQDDRTLSQVVLPSANRTPITIPLPAVSVIDNAVALNLRSYLVAHEGYCLDPANPLRLIDITVRYGGLEASPQAISDFLPPVLKQLTIFLPRTPSRAESEAAIRLSTAVVAHYGKQYTRVGVAVLADGQTEPPITSLPLERQIVIKEDPEGGATLRGGVGVPALLISGPPNQLTNQTRLLWGDIGLLALSSKAVVGPLRSSPQLPPDLTTLRQLGQPGVNATALAPQVAIGLDQTRLGRPAHDIRVHLRGSYTPLPSSVGGQVVAAIGGETIGRWPTDSTGVIDRWVEVPDRLLQRYVNVDVAINIAGNTGRCGEFQPLTLTIDGDSPIESRPAEPPLPGGFQVLPQALMPRVAIGIADGFDNVRRAVTILVALQRLSALPIDIAVTSLQEAIASQDPAVLINAEGWTDDRIVLPVSSDSDGSITIENANGTGAPGTLSLNPGLRFGSLQTISDGRRTVLVATSTESPEELDRLLSWLDSNVERWSRLTGDALIGVPNRSPVVVSTESPRQAETRQAEGNPNLMWIAIAAAGVLVAAGATVILLRSRRSRARQ